MLHSDRLCPDLGGPFLYSYSYISNAQLLPGYFGMVQIIIENLKKIANISLFIRFLSSLYYFYT